MRTIRDNRDKIRKSVPTTTNLSVTRTARSQPDAIEKMAKMLTMWIEHQNQQNMPFSGMDIQEKARSFYGDKTNDPCLFLPVMGGSSISRVTMRSTISS